MFINDLGLRVNRKLTKVVDNTKLLGVVQKMKMYYKELQSNLSKLVKQTLKLQVQFNVSQGKVSELHQGKTKPKHP